MLAAAFWTAFAALVVLDLCVLVSVLRPARRVWPPPGRDTWQFRLVWCLFAVATAGIVVVGVLDWNTFVLDPWLRIPVGAVLAAGGGLFALWGIRHLSWHASLGLEGELVRSGPFRWTRNPEYVGDTLLLMGWGIAANSLAAWILCALGIAWFLAAPWAEEPWLRERYGEPYERYCREVPRFLGVWGLRPGGSGPPPGRG